MEEIAAKIQELVTFYGIKILTAVVIFYVGRLIAKTIRRVVNNLLTKAGMEPTLVSFVRNLTYFAVLAFTILAVLAQLGIQTTSFIAVLGAAGLAVGLALQGSLANFAAGLLMIIFRPFEAGHYIEGAGTSGTVEEIHIFSTNLKTPDNKKVIVPNSKLMGDNIVNYSAKDTRRVDMVFGVSYDDDIKKVREVLQDIIQQDNRILEDPASLIAIKELGDNSVNFVVRVWVKTPDYWSVYFDTTEAVKERFDSEGISFPFPQHDVHIYETK